MKIEKINENQIRCTLSREDLISRHIKLSELAYGSTKARELFRELMEQASYQYGFEAEDIPLMIEAIPLSSESIVLLVTKVESPDELDTRFSRFSECDDDYDDDDVDATDAPIKPFNEAAADDILNIFNSLIEKAQEAIKASPEKAAAKGLPVDITKMFVFDNLEDVLKLSGVLATFYKGKNSLYKSPFDNRYYLVVSKSDDTAENYNKVCNILSEYSDQQNFVVGTDAYMSEHYETMVKGNAIQSLALI
ncbi:adapter protein MecA 1/2 [Pseudobutyrivibrio sp. 49]|uniref:adaptor protein MecA n=1 Tax=unclassified Pseudobutyrivibrio TaxID=2638619 RepID=UPI0008842267|nr:MULTISPECIES: adaptor protein MecA [unclassified Pseudobutyrivibrio]SDH71122.1 adapter protein MecA 1/2 [Pseudobutyrivibrio sp. 49]SFN73806.1 adapter protein MecA 1/2 [Pseudobutyrivibrio sp. UC1225]